MAYLVYQYPDGIYPDEAAKDCPEALEALAVLIRELGEVGPSPEIYSVKTLGKKLGGLWQINLRVPRQVRVLYAPYGNKIVIFCIHKKSSPQEQSRGYETAMRRKAEYEELSKKLQRPQNVGNRTLH